MTPPLKSLDFSEVCCLPSASLEIFFVSVLLISSLILLCSHIILCMTSNPLHSLILVFGAGYGLFLWLFAGTWKTRCVVLLWGQGLHMCQLDAGGRLCCSYSTQADFLSRRWDAGTKVPNHTVDLFIPPSAPPVWASCIFSVCCFLCSHLEL